VDVIVDIKLFNKKDLWRIVSFFEYCKYSISTIKITYFLSSHKVIWNINKKQ